MKRLSWFLLVVLIVALVMPAVSVSAGGPTPTACELTDKGVQLQATARNDGKWMVNRSISGCNLLFEGRLDDSKVHHIYILRSAAGDGPYWNGDGDFIFIEGSVRAYPRDWNMDDFSTAKPPIAAEFVDAKRANMQANGYDWPIWVHDVAGNVLQFGEGTLVPGVVLPINCDFNEPQKINVAGINDPSTGSFNASIGAAGCFTKAWIDRNAPSVWQGAKDNVVFMVIRAWLMPKVWSEDQVKEWIPDGA